MANDGLDIHAFQRWAMGNLVGNYNRGIFAEWLVGQALGAIGPNGYRQEWDAWDLLYGDSKKWKVEVKAAGRDQAWSQDRPSVPRFDIAPRKRTWDQSNEVWIQNNPPARPADLYVFCLHTPEEATNENVLDPDCWQFWVLSSRRLDQDLGQQKSVGLRTLERLTGSTSWSWSELRVAVDRCIQHPGT